MQHTRACGNSRWVLILALSVLLVACSGDQPEPRNQGAVEIRIPSAVQMRLDLPAALTEAEPRPLGSVRRAVGVQGRRLLTGVHQDEIVSNTTFVFDPFFGTANSRATQSDCPGVGPEEPAGIAPNGTYQGLCFARAIQLALKRMASDYNNTQSIIHSVASNVEGVAENVVVQYSNPNLETTSGTGVLIKFKYNCSANCSDPDPDRRDYTYQLGMYPVDDPTTPIGNMTWTVTATGAVSGTMIIDRGLMTLATGWRNTVGNQDVGAPPQIQYTFSSDPSGTLKNFTMKYADIVADEFLHDASVVRVERRPATATEPALWIVQGTVAYNLGLGVNPARGPTWHPQVGNVPVKMHFNAVAEDISEGGRALFNAVLADDAANALVRSTDLTAVSLQDSHLWAAYKKLLQTLYTEENYMAWGLGSGRSLLVWNSGTNDQVNLPSFTGLWPHDFDLSPDGRRLAVAGGDGFLRLYEIGFDATTFGSELLACQPHGGAALYTVRFSADGSEVLTSGADHQVRRIRVADCQVLAELVHPSDPDCGPSAFNGTYSSIRATYFPDGQRIASVQASRNGAMVRVWQADGTLLRSTRQEHIGVAEGYIDPLSASYQCGRMHSIEVDPGNRYVLVGYEDQTARLWNLNNDSEWIMRHAGVDPTAGRLGRGIYAVFNPDGSEVLTGNNGEGSGLYRWDIVDVPAGSPPQVTIDYKYQESTASVNVIAYAGDGSMLFTGEFTRMSVYNVTSQTAVDGSVLMPTTISSDYPALVSGLRAKFLPGQDNSVIFTLDAAGSNSVITVYNTRELEGGSPSTLLPFFGHEGAALGVSYSEDGALLVSAGEDGSVRIWSAHYGTLVRTLLGHGAAADNDSLTNVNTAYFTDNDGKILSAGIDGAAILWDAATGALLRRFIHAAPVNAAVADAAFTRIATASGDGNITLWDPLDATTPLAVLSNAHPGGSNAVAFSPDGTVLASAGSDGYLRFWDLTVTPPAPLAAYNAGVPLYVLDYAPDGSRVATGAGDGTAILVGGDPGDSARFAQRLVAVPHAGKVTAVRFSRHDNGLQLLTARNFALVGNAVVSHEARHFDVDPNSSSYGQLLRVYTDGLSPQYRNSVYSPTFSPDGSRVAAGYPGGKFDPSWVDFEGLWAANDWPDENDVYNPYFLEPVVSTSAADCLQLSPISPSSVAPSCQISCADVPGGCYLYKVKSTYLHSRAPQVSPVIDPVNYLGLSSALDELTLANSWYIDTFTPQPIPDVQ